MKAKKSFGQNWLRDDYTLDTIVDAANISPDDYILEVGPGLGTLTEKLISTKAKVLAVEADKDLIPSLQKKFGSFQNFKLILGDILKFNLLEIEPNFKVVANIPYYLTSNLIRKLLEVSNPPSVIVLLIQKEVAERIIAKPGQMSVLAFSVQYYARAELVAEVKKELFDPIPKVDSAIIRITRLAEPAFSADTKKLFRLVKAGFGEKRKTLRNSLSGGLRISTDTAEALLKASGINPQARAQELSMNDWRQLYKKSLEELVL